MGRETGQNVASVTPQVTCPPPASPHLGMTSPSRGPAPPSAFTGHPWGPSPPPALSGQVLSTGSASERSFKSTKEMKEMFVTSGYQVLPTRTHFPLKRKGLIPLFLQIKDIIITY